MEDINVLNYIRDVLDLKCSIIYGGENVDVFTVPDDGRIVVLVKPRVSTDYIALNFKVDNGEN